MSQIVALPPKVDDSCVQVLDEALAAAKRGDIVRVGIIMRRTAGEWSTAFSASDDSAQDAGMLLELAVRRLGFAFRKEGES